MVNFRQDVNGHASAAPVAGAGASGGRVGAVLEKVWETFSGDNGQSAGFGEMKTGVRLEVERVRRDAFAEGEGV